MTNLNPIYDFWEQDRFEELMVASNAEHNLPYLPQPNFSDVVLSEDCAPRDITPTAFVFQFFKNGDLLLTNNRRRGIEIPGGHIDTIDGRLELPHEAAIREGREETGAVHFLIEPVGFMRNVVVGDKPEGYKYPYPYSAQQFFAAAIRDEYTFEETDECLMPVRMSFIDAKEHFDKNPRTLPLLSMARLSYLLFTYE